MKAQIAKQLDYEPSEPPEQFELLFGEGNLHEAAVVERLIDDGYQIADRQMEVTINNGHGAQIMGHIDGKVLPPDHLRWKVLEIKTVGQSTWDQFEKNRWDTPGLWQKYKWQLSVYMICCDAEALVVIKNRNTGQLRFEGVELPFYTHMNILARLNEMESWVKESALPLECDTVNYPCPFFYLHTEPEKNDLANEEEINARGRVYLQAKSVAEEANDRLKQARASLIEALGDQTKVRTEQLAITYYDYSTTTLDRKRMERDGINVEPYEKVSKSKRLIVKDKAEDGTGQSSTEEAS